MFLIYFILLFLFNFFHFDQKFGSVFTRRDCYRSLSIPIQFIEIQHFFPTGPIHLNINFQIILFKNETDNTPIEYENIYGFERINGSCRSSILFSTKGINFTKMVLSINMVLFDYLSTLDRFLYTFYNGFVPGYYMLLSKYSTFGTSIQIHNSGAQHIQNIHLSFPGDWAYLQFRSHFYNSICIATIHKRPTIIRPDYNREKCIGFTTYIYVVFREQGVENILYQFVAFECVTNELKFNDSIILYDEHSPQANITFYSVHFEIKNNSQYEYKICNFKFHNFKRKKLEELKNHPSDITKIFLIRPIIEYKNLSNDRTLTLYRSSNQKIYRCFITKHSQVLSYVRRLEEKKLY